jgi:hypothetical protein
MSMTTKEETELAHREWVIRLYGRPTNPTPLPSVSSAIGYELMMYTDDPGAYAKTISPVGNQKQKVGSRKCTRKDETRRTIDAPPFRKLLVPIARAELEVIPKDRHTGGPRRVTFLLGSENPVDGVDEHGGHDDGGCDGSPVKHFRRSRGSRESERARKLHGWGYIYI